MLVYGFHSVAARIKQHPESITQLYVDSSRNDPRMRELLALCKASNLEVKLVAGQRLDSLCPNRKHQGVVAQAQGEVPRLDLDQLLDQLTVPPLLLLLDGVTDPRNLGACLRVADGAGVHAVIAPKDHSCMLTETAIQTASGAAETVPYILVTNLSRTIDQLQERNIFVVGAADQADQSIHQIVIPRGVAWVLGAEGTGLRRLTKERCDHLVSIPMAGQVSSLNVSVAAGIILYETVRQYGQANWGEAAA
jgi:23S rRNA (guanosine2251-2'-O)-methyltransferase